jgi:hypothetical protein
MAKYIQKSQQRLCAMAYQHARPGIPFRTPAIPPIFILVGAALALDSAKKYFKRVNGGKCPTCGHSAKKFTVREKSCGHEKEAES